MQGLGKRGSCVSDRQGDAREKERRGQTRCRGSRGNPIQAGAANGAGLPEGAAITRRQLFAAGSGRAYRFDSARKGVAPEVRRETDSA